MTLPTPQTLIEWFASLTGRVPSTDKLAAEQEQQARERREVDRSPRVA